MASSPSPPLSNGAGDLNLGLVLHRVRESADKNLSMAKLTGSEDLVEPPSTSNLWSSIDQCIYLFKSTFDDTPSPHPHSSLVHRRLLHHLVGCASKARRQTDPLLEICKQLLRDVNTHATTETVLSCLINAAQDTSPTVVHRTKKAIIALLRRDKQLDKALVRAEELIAATSGAAPDSIERRSALEQKAHILMDRRNEGDLHKALQLCTERVGMRYRGVGQVYRDKSAMYTIEDIAKIHDELNNLQISVVWLKQAAVFGKDLKVDRMAMTHIVDKLADAQKKLQQHSELGLYKEIFGPFMWVPQ